MFRDPIVLLKNEARQKPHIKELLDNVHLMSETDIKLAKVLPWIKKALSDIKKIESAERQYKNMLDYMSDKIIDSKLHDPMGETRKWLGDLEYIKMGTGMVEIKPNQLIWFDNKGGVWLDTIYSKIIDPKLLRYTQSCGETSKLDYFGLERQRRNGTMDTPPHTVVYGSETTTLTTSPVSGLFTIYRP